MTDKLIFIIFLIVLTSICDTISQLFLKTSINSLNFTVYGVKKIFAFIRCLIAIPRIWIGALFSLSSLLIWLFVLSKAELNFAFSVDSMHYIFIALAARFILKEKIGVLRWIGTMLIIAGIILVTLTEIK